MAEVMQAAADEATRTPSYPFEAAPAAGNTIEVASGVLWLRMPLPFALEFINLWAIADGEGWTIVDTGVHSPETVGLWQEVLAGPLGGRPVTRVIVTHMHPDHIGMAGWLSRHPSCRLWTTRLEYLMCRVLVNDTGREAPDDGLSFYRAAGWHKDVIEGYQKRFGGFGQMVYALPDSFRRIEDGERLSIGGREWHVVVGRGHSPEHACLYCPDLKLFISGDQVLPRISSNVSVFPTEPDADPLGEWLESLERIGRIVPDDVLVLPAHNLPFHGLHARLRQLVDGHLMGLARLRAKLATPRRAIDVFDALFSRPIGTETLGMATGESLAHLNYLWRRGEIGRVRDAGEVDWYTLLPSAED